MRKISSLVEHLLTTTRLPREQAHAFADKGELQPTGGDLGLTPDGRAQLEVGVWKYDAVIRLERYAGDGPTLMAIVLGWLADHDGDRDGLAEPELDVDINDARTCDVELAVEFEERITVVEDPAGAVPFDGRRWSVAAPEIVAAGSFTFGARRGGGDAG